MTNYEAKLTFLFFKSEYLVENCKIITFADVLYLYANYQLIELKILKELFKVLLAVSRWLLAFFAVIFA